MPFARDDLDSNYRGQKSQYSSGRRCKTRMTPTLVSIPEEACILAKGRGDA